MFNPQARWDRHFPADSEENAEKISVTAQFRGGEIFPQAFSWHNNFYEINEITYAWKESVGALREAPLHYFTVNTARGLFEISFSPKNLTWRLLKHIV